MPVWALGVSCETPAAFGPPGFTRQPENSKRAHLRVPALQTNTTKIPRENSQRDRQRAKMGAGEGKNNAKFLAPTLTLGPDPSGPHFSGSGAPPFGAHPSGPVFVLLVFLKKKKRILFVVGPRDKNTNFGQSRFGQSRPPKSWPKSVNLGWAKSVKVGLAKVGLSHSEAVLTTARVE